MCDRSDNSGFTGTRTRPLVSWIEVWIGPDVEGQGERKRLKGFRTELGAERFIRNEMKRSGLPRQRYLIVAATNLFTDW